MPISKKSGWQPLCATAEVPLDCGRRVDVDGWEPLAVFRVAADYFVTVDTCSHGNASLCEGPLEHGEVECPFHAGRFDVRTGAVTAYPAEEPIRVFAVDVRDGVVYARLDDAA